MEETDSTSHPRVSFIGVDFRWHWLGTVAIVVAVFLYRSTRAIDLSNRSHLASGWGGGVGGCVARWVKVIGFAAAQVVSFCPLGSLDCERSNAKFRENLEMHVQ